MKKLLLALAASVLVVTTASAQKETTKVTQSGGDVTIKHKGIPLAVYNGTTGDTMSAIVEDTLTGISVELPGGRTLNLTSLIEQSIVFPFAVIRVRREGFAPVIFKMNALTDTTSKTIVLEPHPLGTDSATMLAPVIVKATRSQIEERARFWGIPAIAPGVLQTPKYERMTLRDALRENHFVGDFPERGDSRDNDKPKLVMAGQGKKGGECKVRIVLDMSVPAGKQVNLDDPASMYDGIEFYKSHVYAPEQFKSLIGICGTLLIWTRGR